MKWRLNVVKVELGKVKYEILLLATHVVEIMFIRISMNITF